MLKVIIYDPVQLFADLVWIDFFDFLTYHPKHRVKELEDHWKVVKENVVPDDKRLLKTKFIDEHCGYILKPDCFPVVKIVVFKISIKLRKKYLEDVFQHIAYTLETG